MTTAICIASGPSLTAEDVDYCRGKGKVYVVNNCYQLAPWADVLYACDQRWWDMYIDDVREKFKGELWTIDTRAAEAYRLNTVGVANNVPFSTHPEAIALGSNSGFQAKNLAYIQGASRIILLGYDMAPRADGVRHWHGDHPRALLQTNAVEYPKWVQKFNAAAPHIPVPVINCSRVTALECFERRPLRETI